MSNVWNKIDSGLARIYANFLSVRDQGSKNKADVPPQVAAGRKLLVEICYKGDLRPVENAGFETKWTEGQGQAIGALSLENLHDIAEQDEVLTIVYGRAHDLELDRSGFQIEADQVWIVDEESWELTGQPPDGATGKDVIVGIIDTGIDFTHPFFYRFTTTEEGETVKRTRIKRIWDMGLKPRPGETGPESGHLYLGTIDREPYGVEYTENQINAVLNHPQGTIPPPMPIRHIDPSGHGTHVASIAAGDGIDRNGRLCVSPRPRVDQDYNVPCGLRGVAPEADLVIVKIEYLEDDPEEGPDPDYPEVGPDLRFKDAVTYILNVAEEFEKPVVINHSRGEPIGPHDGFDFLEDWLNNEFHESEGKIFINSAGNLGGKRQHAKIEFPNDVEYPTQEGVSIEIPFRLVHASSRTNPKNLEIDFWYPHRDYGGAKLTGKLKPPKNENFSPEVPLGLTSPSVDFFAGRQYTITHSEKPGFINGVPAIKRNNFNVEIKPAPPPNNRHVEGMYVVQLTAYGPMTVHAWCTRTKNDIQFIEVDPPTVSAESTVATYTVEDEYLVTSPGCCKNVITVGSYNAETLDVAKSSSRGPVPRYHGGAEPNKPDIGAPGVQIYAAWLTQEIRRYIRGIIFSLWSNTAAKNGTSMAAPHVTGAVALMLQKNKYLTPSQVLGLLTTTAHRYPTPETVLNQIGAGRLNANQAFIETPYQPETEGG